MLDGDRNSNEGGHVDRPKQGRTTAKRMFTLSIKSLENAMSNAQSKSMINTLFDNVSEYWSKLQDEHAKYLNRLLGDDDENIPDEEVKWLLECSTKYANAGTAKDKYINQSDNAAKIIKEVNIKRRGLKFEMSSLASCIDNLNQVSVDLSASAQVIQETHQRMKCQLERYLTSQRELVMELDDDEDVEKELAVCGRMEKLCLQASVSAAQRTEEEEKTKITNQKSSSSAFEIKLNRITLPTFEGDIREYARFKSEYMKIVKPAVRSNDDAVYILKNECLKKDAKEHVQNIDDDLEEIWRRLEDRFGRPELAARAFLSDMKQITPVAEGDTTKFIKLVDTVERGFKGLQRINMQEEIANATVVSTIEEKLPPSLKTRWSIEVCCDEMQPSTIQQGASRKESSNRFQQLLEFLLRHRRAMEYSSADALQKKAMRVHESPVHHVQLNHHVQLKTEDNNVNSARGPGCWIHSTNSHTIHECTAYANAHVNEKWDLVLNYRACWCCLKRGHRQADCYNIKECGINGCKSKHHETLHRTDSY